MTIRIPDTLTIDNSGKYILSIRLRSDGLCFSGYMPAVPGSFFLREVTFERGLSVLAGLQELFYTHDFLAWSYKETRIIICTTQYTLVPEVLYQEKKKEDFLSFLFSFPEKKCITNVLEKEQARLLFGMDNELYEFCARSFIHPQFIHSLTPLALWWSGQSQLSLPCHMYVVFHGREMDVFCYEQGKLTFANSFQTEKAEDALYYILYVWRQAGLDQEKDILLYSSGATKSLDIEPLQRYLRHVHPVEIPADVYLLGDEIHQAPIDLIASIICES